MASLIRDEQELLRPYLPRLLLQWLADGPEDAHRVVEGSVAFVDISGFTRLSERLAKLGKVGAEDLTDAISTCFTRLLGIAYANGGGLIKFGGDALLLLFTGRDHAAKAARAAIGMRRELREIGSLGSSGRGVRLRMSVGVHSGQFHFFLIGSSHRELIITGPAATETVLMESTAEAGEIVISPATASALPRGIVGAAKGPGVLLRKEPPGLEPERSSADLPPTVQQMLRCIPTATREHVLAGLHEPEHKRVTVAFLHFDGTDDLIATQGPEGCAHALDALVKEVQDAADRHGVCFLGSDVDRDGGKIILTGGAPTSSENDEERMLLTVRQIVESDPPLPLRIGVNRGHVFAGDIGPFYRRTYTVMGDAVNLAARLMAKAQPGEILATEAVIQPSRTRFEATPLEPFNVKGKAHPVQAFRVGRVERGRRPAAETHAPSSPLIGRERELEILLAALVSAREGHGRIVEIVGEPGIGKSRLIEELKTHARDFTILSAACELYQVSTPYAPLAGPLRRLFGIGETDDDSASAERLRAIVGTLAPHLLPWTPLLGLLLEVDIPPTPEVTQLDDEFRRKRLEHVAVELLTALLSEPTLFVFEDTHWMDEASSDLLHRLTVDMGNVPWLFCVSRRDVQGGFAAQSPPADVLRPKPLDPAAAAALVDSVTEDMPLAPHEITALAERSGGNPLFLKELLTAARAAGGIEGLPDSVEALITARIDSLPVKERTILKRLSVLGPTFNGELARAVVPSELAADDGAWDRLEEFVSIDDEDMFTFRHALIRDAAYDGLPFRLRRELHALVGETIEREAGVDADEHAEILSLHFFSAHGYGRAWHYSRVAADRARMIYANVDAAGFLQRAIESAKKEDNVASQELSAVLESLGDVRARIGEFSNAAAAYRSSLRLAAGEPIVSARLLLKQARVRRVSGRYADALRWIRRARKALESAQGPEAARQRAQLAVAQAAVHRVQGRSRDVIKWCKRVIEQDGEGDRDALAHACYLLDSAYVDLGMWEEAKFSDLALAIYEELNDLAGQGVVLNNLGGRAYWRGEWNVALELYERGRVAREKIGDAVNAAYGTVNIGEILLDQGRLDEAEPMLRQAARVWKAAGDRVGVAFATSLLGRLLARRRRFEEALNLLDEARTESERSGAEAIVLEIDAKIAECHILSGDGPAAREVADQALKAVKLVGAAASLTATLHRIKGWALLQLCDLEGARRSFEESLEIARARNAEYEVALALRALHEIERLEGDPGSDEGARESAEILDRLGVVRVFEPFADTAGATAPNDDGAVVG